MTPRIETIKETKLVGKRLRMSFANNRTAELWRGFSPRRKEIKNSTSSDLYSVDIYPDKDFFTSFAPTKEFEKWAAVEVSDFDSTPDEMEQLIIPQGQYAVFHYQGKPSEAQETFLYIYAVWLPQSEYEMDKRPYFALMGEAYKGEDPNSEEDFWVPIRTKK